MFSKKEKIIYMDHAAGTPIHKKVFDMMKPYFTQNFFNPSSLYSQGVEVNRILELSRKKIADSIHARPQEIIFTDGGTEANNIVIRGLVSRWNTENNKKAHVITSNIEHASILETIKSLEKKGELSASYISVNDQGQIDIKELKDSIRENTILVSIGYVNGEIGVIQDIKLIAKNIRHYRKHHSSALPYFHTDAIQAVNYLDINVQKLGIDLMTINGSKIYGPKKIAALYKKTNIECDAIMSGGNQEYGIRPGTENIPYIVGFAESVECVSHIRKSEFDRLKLLQAYTERELIKKMNVDFIINTVNTDRIPNIVNISIPFLSSEEIMLRLDAVGIKVSVKSACKSTEQGDSHVIRALRTDNTQSIRFSFGQQTKKKDIDYMIQKLVHITDAMNTTYNMYL